MKMMTVRPIELFHLRIPFKRKYKHSLAERAETSNLVVKINTSEGVTGWGETIPREYLTGETVESAARFIKERFPPNLPSPCFKSAQDVSDYLQGMSYECDPTRAMAALCGLELAVLDAAGKYFNISAGNAVGNILQNKIHYTAPIDAGSLRKVKKRAWLFRLAGFRDFKVKVGGPDDVAAVAAVRRIAGKRANIRIDANCAWSAEEAVAKLREMSRFGISSVEQPVEARDLVGMREVRERSGVPVMADESLCTMDDAKALVAEKACDIFNVRLAKCGGMLACKRLIDFARENNIQVQLGCLVGETGILSAAERIFAGRVEGVIHHEFSFPCFLLEKDIVENPVSVGYHGVGKVRTAETGLGVSINEKILAQYATCP